jgi:hypothetical protein
MCGEPCIWLFAAGLGCDRRSGHSRKTAAFLEPERQGRASEIRGEEPGDRLG